MKKPLAILPLFILLSGINFPQQIFAELQSPTYQCQPTPEDEMGPFYRPGAPLRSRIGTGYLLSGTVKSATDCAPIPSPLIEFWQTAPNGRYDDAHRAAIITDGSGNYQLETNFPPPYVTRPSHIHIRVSANNFQTLVTQHYLQSGVNAATFDLVLIPESTANPQ